MLSSRGQENADQLNIPWRFAQATKYDPVNNPEGIISFGTAENALMQKELEGFASKVHIPGSAFRYAYTTAGGAHLPLAFACHINDLFNPYIPVTNIDVKVSAAATALHDILAYSLCEPGEGILTTKPYYGRFELDFGNKANVQVIAADTDHEKCFETGVVNALEKGLRDSEMSNVRIRAVLIVNPHNPLGRCYPRKTLVAIMHFCAENSLHLISDEIYALSVFSNPQNPNCVPFTSVLSINPTGIINRNYLHVTYGLSKDFASAGLKIGALISHNNELKKAVHAVLRFHGVSGPAVAIATAMLKDRVWCRGGNAGFFLWVDLSEYLPPKDVGNTFQRECMLAKKFTDGGIFLHPGEEHSVRPGWFRLVFTFEGIIVEEGMKRIQKVLSRLEW
ncbi:putative aspartate aminotransferase [Phaeosphaeriaceae sp. PMI808]|nr:putative aspartate aminotransferase [Phaeosphaeriaceae sp. PMI808]